MTDLRGERVDEGKVWAACPRCAKLRARVRVLEEAYEVAQREWETWVDSELGGTTQYKHAMEECAENRRRAGRE